MELDGPVELSGLRDAFSWDARRGAPWESGGPQPPARFGNFSAVKVPRRRQTSLPRLCAGVEQTRLRRVRGRCGLQGSAACGRKSDRSSWAAACLGGPYADREGLAATRTIGPYENGKTNGLPHPPHPSREAADAARAAYSRPYGTPPSWQKAMTPPLSPVGVRGGLACTFDDGAPLTRHGRAMRAPTVRMGGLAGM